MFVRSKDKPFRLALFSYMWHIVSGGCFIFKVGQLPSNNII